jgi:hypothetical protein
MSADPREFLDEAEIDEETLEESLRAYVFQSSDFLPPDRMRAALAEAYGEDPVADALKTLEADPEARSALARALLEASWAVPGEAEKIRSATEYTTEKLPVVTLSITAIALLYGYWLHKTGGVKEVRKTTKTAPDGTTTETEVKSYYPFGTPLGEIFRRLGW